MLFVPEWSLLLVAKLGLASGLGQNSSLGNENDVLARKLLLQLAYKAGLDLLERTQLRHRHKDDDGLLAANFNLLCSCNVQFS